MLLEEAARHRGARWLPGYPKWLWRLHPGSDDDLTGEIHSRLVDLP